MSYIVLARRYRPKTFDQIMGQPHITTTLKNAISQDRVAHAYIFAGPRGVGKTTTARILAKALNCEKGPAPEPCNSCASCAEITKGTSLDILEIDGASNRGIEEIRNLKENVRFSPSKGKFKIYIIDEVHMLTAEAFNALLKTLEEPPPHVKFIFATTQIHKVPPTILSRCQRFDFRRISTRDILDNLKGIIKEETLDVSGEALALIAKYADGSMRDGQVILDQIISFTQGKTDVEDVTRVLGVIDDDIIFAVADSIKQGDSIGALKTIDRLSNDGKDMIQVILNLIEHYRNLSMVKISPDLESLIDAGADKLKRYEEQAGRFSIEEILYITYALTGALDLARKTRLGRIPFEMTVLKLTKMGPMMPLKDIMDSLGRLNDAASEPRRAPGRIAVHAEKIDMGEKASGMKDPPAANNPGKRVSLDDVLTSWGSVINYIKSKKISVASYLEEGYPTGLEGRSLSIGFPKEFQFHKEVLESPENKRLIAEAIEATLNADFRVEFVSVEPVNVPRRAAIGQPERDADTEGPLDTGDAGIQKNAEPLIDEALKIFGGEITKRNNAKERPR